MESEIIIQSSEKNEIKENYLKYPKDLNFFLSHDIINKVEPQAKEIINGLLNPLLCPNCHNIVYFSLNNENPTQIIYNCNCEYNQTSKNILDLFGIGKSYNDSFSPNKSIQSNMDFSAFIELKNILWISILNAWKENFENNFKNNILQKINIQCTIHTNIELKFFCKNCFKNICFKCKESHDKNHEIIEIKSIFIESDAVYVKNTYMDLIEIEKNYLNKIIFMKFLKNNSNLNLYEHLQINYCFGLLFEMYYLLCIYFKSQQKFTDYRIYQGLKTFSHLKLKKIIGLSEFDIKNDMDEIQIKNEYIINEYLKENFIFSIYEQSQSDFENLFYDVKYQIQIIKNIELEKLDYFNYKKVPITCIITIKNYDLLVCGENGKMKLYDKDNLKFYLKISAHKASISNAIYLGDNKIITCSIDCTIKIWKIIDYDNQWKLRLIYKLFSNYHCLNTLILHQLPILKIIEINDKNYNVYNYENDLKDKLEKTNNKLNNENNNSCKNDIKNDIKNSFINHELQEKKFISISLDNNIKIWDLEGKIIDTLHDDKSTFKSAEYLKNGILVTVNDDLILKFWNIQGFFELNLLELKDFDCVTIDSLKYLNDNILLIGGFNYLIIFNYVEHKIIEYIYTDNIINYCSFLVLNERSFIVGTKNYYIQYKLTKDKCVELYKWKNSHENFITSIVNPKDNIIISGGRDSGIYSYYITFEYELLQQKV